MTRLLGPVDPSALPVQLSTLADYLGVVLDPADVQAGMTLQALALAALDYAEFVTGRDWTAKRYVTETAPADASHGSLASARSPEIIRLRPAIDDQHVTVTVDGQPYAGEVTVWSESGVIRLSPVPAGKLVIEWRTLTPAQLPAAVEAAVMLLVSHWWNRRDQAWQVSDTPYGVNSLLRSAAVAGVR
jgi:hypothetical protein